MEINDRRIPLGFALVSLFIFVAFFRTYFGLVFSEHFISFPIHLHVLLVVLWFAMLILQALLARQKKLALHRTIGKTSYLLVPLLVLSCLWMTRNEQLRQKDVMVFAINLFDTAFFIFCYALGMLYKRRTSWHVRFMILTVIPFIDPAAARLQLPGTIIQLLILLFLLLGEFFTSKIYKPYAYALLGFVGMALLLVTSVFVQPQLIEACWRFFFA